jgi:hypothetical protein
VNLLTKESQKKGKRFQELVDDFNRILFLATTDDMDPQSGMTKEEKELDKAIEEDVSGGGDEDEDGGRDEGGSKGGDNGRDDRHLSS